MSGLEVLGAIETVYSLGCILADAISTIVNAPAQIKDLQNELENSLSAFLEVKDYYEECKPDEHATQRIKDLQLARLKEIIDGYKALITILSKFEGATGRVRWLVQKSEKEEARSKLQRYNYSLQLLLAVWQLRTSREASQKMTTNLDKLHREILRGRLDDLFPTKRIQDIRDKLTRGNIDSQFSKPDWYLDREGFRTWKFPEFSQWMWAMGEQGSGKTVFASYMATELTKMPETGVAIFYYDHNEKNENQRFEVVLRCLCRQLLDQLWERDPFQADVRVRELDSEEALDSSGDADDNIMGLKLLKGLVNDFDQSYIIIDALDEYPVEYKTLLGLLNGILQDQPQNPSSTPLKVFVTSRPGPEMLEYAKFFGALRVTISPEDEKLRDYVLTRLHNPHQSRLKSLEYREAIREALEDEKTRIDAASKIVSASTNSFLLADLHLKTLANCSTRPAMVQRLDHLPQGLDEFFRDVMKRIESQEDETLRFIGKSTLLWTMHSARTLKVAELCHAVAAHQLPAMRKTGISLDTAGVSIPTSEDLLKATCYFLGIEKESSTIRVHKTVRDFFKSNPQALQKHFNDVQQEMANSCMRYLTLNDFASGSCRNMEEWKVRTRDYPFLEYAAANWGLHVGQSLRESFFFKDDAYIRILDFFKSDSAIACASQALQPSLPANVPWRFRDNTWANIPEGEGPTMYPLHLATQFDLRETVQLLLDQPDANINILSRGNMTALCMACRLGHSEIVKELLRRGADPVLEVGEGGVQLNKGYHCLAEAAFNGHTETVKILLKHPYKQENVPQRIMQQKNTIGRSIIADGVIGRHKDVLRVLLDELLTMKEKGTEILHCQQHNGLNAMHHAAWTDNEEIVQMLLSHPGSERLLTQHDKAWKDTPLHSATSSGSFNSIKTLVRHRRSLINTERQSQGKTPLHLAVQMPFNESKDIVKFMFENGADAGVRDYEDRTAIHAAADHGRIGQLHRVLNHARPDLINSKDNHGRTPLQRAVIFDAGRGPECVRLLLDINADALQKDKYGKSGFDAIMASSNEGYINAALDSGRFAGTLLPTKTANGWSVEGLEDGAIMAIVRSRKERLISAVVDSGKFQGLVLPYLIIDYQVGNLQHLRRLLHSDSQTSLRLKLIRVGGRPEDAFETSLLHLAAKDTYIDVVQAILDTKLGRELLPVKDSDGQTPLHIAAAQGHIEMAQAMLDSLADVNIRDKDGQLPLDLATKSNLPDMVSLLASSAKVEVPHVSWADPVTDLKLETPDSWKHMRFMRDSLVRVRAVDNFIVERMYLLSQPIPKCHLPIQRIVIRIVSHDQGFSDFPGKGTYNGSCTWFQLSRFRNDKFLNGLRLTSNIHCSSQKKVHTIALDSEAGFVGNGDVVGTQNAGERAKQFLREVQVGERIALLARAQLLNWENFVYRAEIVFYYKED